MSKIFAVHTIELLPGVSADAFDEYLHRTARSVPSLPGWSQYVVKGERGERAGKYAVIHEFESAEARNRYFPTDGTQSAEFAEYLDKYRSTLMEWDNFATRPGTTYTDYFVVA